MVTTGGRTTRTIPVTKKSTHVPLFAGVAVSAVVLTGAVWWFAAGRNQPGDAEPRDSASTGRSATSATTSGTVASAPGNGAAGAGAQSAIRSTGDAAWVNIAEGDYTIGSDSGPALVHPRHVEHVAAFRMERTEVTVDAYNQFVVSKRAPSPWGAVKPLGTLPVTRVPWGDAANYCALKYPNSGRLPTEVEWEAAARGIAGRSYPYGNAPDGANTNTESARRAGPAPVGSFPRGATPEGLADMSGNVWEWTSSPVRAYAGAKQLPDSMGKYRVIRGGAFDTRDEIATGWMRGYLKVSSTPAELPNTGFRCASTVTENSARGR